MAAIIAEGLSKVYTSSSGDVVGLHPQDFTIAEGEISALLGPNGAGKTTTLRLLTTLIRPTTGTATVNGYDIISEPENVRNSIGVVTESPGMDERLSGRYHLEFYGRIYGMPREVVRNRANEILEELDLADSADRPFGSYSKGMKQKVLIGRSLIHEPNLLVYDEPMSGLSPEMQQEVRRLMQNLVDQGKTIVLSTHNLAEAERIVDRFYIIDQGKFVEFGTHFELRKKYTVDSVLRLRLDKEIEEESLRVPKVKDVRVKPSGNIAYLYVDTFENTPDIVRSIVESGARIREIEEMVPSLEEVYLKLTGDKE